MKITAISILRLKHGSDKVYVETDLPDAGRPPSPHLTMTFVVARGEAEDYCAKHFPDVPIKEVL